MRKLTIKRIKSFVACLGKMKVYIEDPYSNEITINDVPCRKLGTLKNNEEKTFEIGEEQAKVFVIADKLSKSFCNEFYPLPAGQEDIFLSGRNKYNLANGHAFRFDNNDNEEAQQNRKKGFKKGLLVMCIAALVGAVIGFIGTSNILFSDPEPKTFSDNGMSITLTDEFKKTEYENFTTCYDSKHVAVFALKEEFTLFEGFEDYTLEEYGDLVFSANDVSDSTLKTVDGLTYFEFEFTNPDTKQLCKYIAFIYKSDNAFWMIQFATLAEDMEEYRPNIIEWAKTVSFE